MSEGLDFASARVVASVLAAVAAWFVAALLWRFVEPSVLPRVRWSLRRLRRVRPRFRLWRRLVEASPVLYRAYCRARYARERCSGLTGYEEWVAEAESLPRAARAALLREIARYRPSPRLVRRARCLSGRLCSSVVR